ncbi:hypothetical protein ACOSQ4_017331 [Xanthoceras sorbifolium]
MELEGCRIVEKVWMGDPMVQGSLGEVVSSSECCAARLKVWRMQQRGRLRRQISKKKDILRRLTESRVVASWQQINAAERQLDELLYQEEDYWRQRSQVAWLWSGDWNSRFFHSQASKRKKINAIKRLVDSGGVWTEDGSDIDNIIENYFNNIFTSQQPSHKELEAILGDVEQRIFMASFQFLKGQFSREEVRQALFMMASSKAPGVDGFNAGFY